MRKIGAIIDRLAEALDQLYPPHDHTPGKRCEACDLYLIRTLQSPVSAADWIDHHL